jgi:hypothetical protein
MPNKFSGKALAYGPMLSATLPNGPSCYLNTGRKSQLKSCMSINCCFPGHTSAAPFSAFQVHGPHPRGNSHARPDFSDIHPQTLLAFCSEFARNLAVAQGCLKNIVSTLDGGLCGANLLFIRSVFCRP